MRRWWLWIVLLLSLGANAGILLTLALSERTASSEGDPPIESGDAWRERTPRPGLPPDGGPGDPGDPEGPRGERRILERLAERFGLEGEERERFFELQRGFFQQAFRSRQQGRRLQRELGLELSAPEPDRRRIEALIDELAQTRQALDRALADTVLATRELLDEPHETEYLVFLRRLRDRMGRDGREGPRRRGPPLRRPPTERPETP